jgi:hypothetical protein
VKVKSTADAIASGYKTGIHPTGNMRIEEEEAQTLTIKNGRLTSGTPKWINILN